MLAVLRFRLRDDETLTQCRIQLHLAEAFDGGRDELEERLLRGVAVLDCEKFDEFWRYAPEGSSD